MKERINSFLSSNSFRRRTKLIERLNEKKVIMKKTEKKRHQIGGMIIKGCYVKELQKEVFDLQELLNEAEKLNN